MRKMIRQTESLMSATRDARRQWNSTFKVVKEQDDFLGEMRKGKNINRDERYHLTCTKFYMIRISTTTQYL